MTDTMLERQLACATDIDACFCIGCGQPDEPDLHDRARCPAAEGGVLDVLTIADAVEVYDTSCDELPELDGDARALHCAIVGTRMAFERTVDDARVEAICSSLSTELGQYPEAQDAIKMLRQLANTGHKLGDGAPDAAIAIGEHAFRAGFAAGDEWGNKDSYLRGNQTDGGAVNDAWSDYEPSEDIKALS